MMSSVVPCCWLVAFKVDWRRVLRLERSERWVVLAHSVPLRDAIKEVQITSSLLYRPRKVDATIVRFEVASVDVDYTFDAARVVMQHTFPILAKVC